MKLPERDPRPQVQELLQRIKGQLEELDPLLERAQGDWFYEDGVYRFYHQSFKVYGLQGSTKAIVDALRSLSPDGKLNEDFETIISEGTGLTFEQEHNERWMEVTRPILEAFFHAKYFLEMVCRYGRALEVAPGVVPSGWASVLYLYNLRYA